jgi:predicted nucleic acid-binding protein
VTLVIDAAPLVALADKADAMREPVRDLLAGDPGPLVIPAPVTAEVDYLLGVRHGQVARRRFIADLAARRLTVGSLEWEDYASVADLESRYEDLRLGLADCSLIILARRFKTRRLLSFDERHFRAVTPLQGGAFTLLPADA